MFPLMSSSFAEHTGSAVEMRVPGLQLRLTSADTLALGSSFPLFEPWEAPCFITYITPSSTWFHWTSRNELGSSWSGVLSPILHMEKPRLGAGEEDTSEVLRLLRPELASRSTLPHLHAHLFVKSPFSCFTPLSHPCSAGFKARIRRKW